MELGLSSIYEMRSVLTFHPFSPMDLLNHSKPVFEIEKNWNESLFHNWIRINWSQSFIYAIIYMAFIVLGQWWMRERQKYDLRLPLIIWSSVLAVFSILASIRTLPELIAILSTEGFKGSVCNPSYYDYKVTAFWSCMFVVSKPYELGDTIFIVLRKQKLIFLHWYHHITVMIYVWISYTEHNAAGRWFYVMNYIVHAVMYSYYALRAMRFAVPRIMSMGVTALQIMQMIIGSTVIGYTAWLRFYAKSSCNITDTLIIAGGLMYLSYLILFTQFFITTYMIGGQRTSDGSRSKLVESMTSATSHISLETFYDRHHKHRKGHTHKHGDHNQNSAAKEMKKKK